MYLDPKDLKKNTYGVLGINFLKMLVHSVMKILGLKLSKKLFFQASNLNQNGLMPCRSSDAVPVLTLGK